MPELIKNLIMIAIFTAITAFGDSRGFLYGSVAWKNGILSTMDAVKSLSGFGIGAVGFVLMVRYLNRLNLQTPEIITLVWFVATMILVALASGKFLAWPKLDQFVALVILVGLGYLVYRTGG